MLARPLAFLALFVAALSAAPLHAQHTDEVLAEIGYDAARLAGLRERGAIV